jgi:hypothetical protein
MRNELERIWKEAFDTSSSYYPGICLEMLRKTMKSLGQDNQWNDRDSTRQPPEYECTALPVHQAARYEEYE